MGSDASQSSELTSAQLERLLDVGRALVSELDLEAVLRSVLDAARDLTGAKYAALGILDDQKRGLDRFVFVGIDERTRQSIGPLPRGRGVLGELIRSPEPLRLADVGAHEHSYGFPANHPPMKTFLGTPVVIRGEAWGNLYLTEKSGGGEFTDADERIAIILAAWASVAIENARLYEGIDRRRAELEHARRGLEMSADISRAAASGMSIGNLLELIAKRGRSLVNARTTLVLIAGEDDLVVASAAGEGAEELLARRARAPESAASELGIQPAAGEAGVMVASLPLRGREPGALVAVGPGGPEGFSRDDRRMFDSYAISAATTIASVRSAEAEKVKLSIQASEREKQRWARELHDQTLQELGALRFLLETAAKGTPNQLRAASERAIEHVDRGIQNLQGLINELRPASLDDLGVGPAIEALVRDTSETTGIPIEARIDLAYEQGREPARHTTELESAIYRLVQESLNNAVKHAGPSEIRIDVEEDGKSVTLRVGDDGSGFDPLAVRGRFGLLGMRERVELAGGELEIDSERGSGTTVTASLPVIRRASSSPGPGVAAPADA